MTEEDAERFLLSLGGNTYIDYLKGRVMKIDVAKNPLDACLYDRDNGQGAAARALVDLLIAAKGAE